MGEKKHICVRHSYNIYRNLTIKNDATVLITGFKKKKIKDANIEFKAACTKYLTIII